MTISRISTIETSRMSLSTINDVMAKMGELQRQITSERQVDDFFDLGKLGGIEKIIDASKQLNDNKNYKETNQIVSTRIRQMDLAVSDVIDVASRTRDMITQRRSPSGKVMQFSQNAKNNLGLIQERLNSNIGGRYLFAGSRTDVIPVKNIVNDTNVVGGSITDNYYQGNDDVLQLQAGVYLNIKYGVNANDEGFKTLIGSINTAIEADMSGNEAGLEKAMDLINISLTRLTELRSSTASNLQVIENANESIDKTCLYLQEITDETMKTDIAQATLLLGSNEAVLRATYMTFSRLSRLTLAEFL